MVIQRSMNTVPIRLHMRLNRMDLQPIQSRSQNMFLNEISKAGPSLCLCERLLPVFMEQQNQQPDVTEDHSTCFSHGKGPWYSRHAV